MMASNKSTGKSLNELKSGLGSGKKMPKEVQSSMEGSFRTDLSGVNLFESPMVSQGGAEAVASGRDIAFAPGKLDFGSKSGRELLGHELSHVVSQGRGEVSGHGVVKSSALESKADAEGAKAAASFGGVTPMSGGLGSLSSAGAVQCKKDKKNTTDPKIEKFASNAELRANRMEHMEEYTPMAQRMYLTPGNKRTLTEQFTPEQQATMWQDMQNMSDNFYNLKQGDDQNAFHEHMLRQASHMFRKRADYNEQYHADGTGTMDSGQTALDFISSASGTMLMDESYTSPEFLGFLQNKVNQQHANNHDEFAHMAGLSKDEKKAAMAEILNKPESVEWMNLIYGIQGVGQSLGQVMSNEQYEETFGSVSKMMPEDGSVDVNLAELFRQEINTHQTTDEQFDTGLQQYRELIATPSHKPDMSGGVHRLPGGHARVLANAAAPLAEGGRMAQVKNPDYVPPGQRKKHRFRRWMN